MTRAILLTTLPLPNLDQFSKEALEGIAAQINEDGTFGNARAENAEVVDKGTFLALEADILIEENPLPPAKSPFAEWAGVPVTVENMKPMSFWGMIDGSDSESVFYLNYSKWDISVSIRRDRIVLGLPDVSYSIHPRDIAHLLEIISGFDPQAFEKGGEG